jgi:hypothetical protein
MSEIKFSVPGQEPIDPAYVRFRDGWEKHIIGHNQ